MKLKPFMQSVTQNTCFRGHVYCFISWSFKIVLIILKSVSQFILCGKEYLPYSNCDSLRWVVHADSSLGADVPNACEIKLFWIMVSTVPYVCHECTLVPQSWRHKMPSHSVCSPKESHRRRGGGQIIDSVRTTHLKEPVIVRYVSTLSSSSDSLHRFHSWWLSSCAIGARMWVNGGLLEK